MSPILQVADALTAGCAQATRRGVDYLLSLQRPEGYWWADLTADTTLESDFILLELWRHPPKNGVWNPPSRERIERAVQSILDRQLADGGFNIYAEGPSEISATVKAYTSLKLAGLDYDDPNLSRARERILATASELFYREGIRAIGVDTVVEQSRASKIRRVLI